MPTEEKQMTALTEFIIELERRLAIIQSENTMLREQMISNILVDADKYLATERQQLIDAYRSGKINQLENSETYYNQTFKPQ